MSIRGIGAISLAMLASVHGASIFTYWEDDWPQRFGVSVTGYSQSQDYIVTDAIITLGTLLVPKEAIVAVENEVSQIGVKVDYWLLPFLNLHAILGYVDGETLVTPIAPFEPTPVKYTGVVYGAGATLAYGGEHWFASATAVYTETQLDRDDITVTALRVAPRLGVRSDNVQAWVGANYLRVKEHQVGTFNVPTVGEVLFDIELEAAEEWNPVIGARYSFSDDWHLTAEYGFGGRESVLLNVEFRF